jgi:hypothetical protein
MRETSESNGGVDLENIVTIMDIDRLDEVRDESKLEDNRRRALNRKGSSRGANTGYQKCEF